MFNAKLDFIFKEEQRLCHPEELGMQGLPRLPADPVGMLKTQFSLQLTVPLRKVPWLALSCQEDSKALKRVVRIVGLHSWVEPFLGLSAALWVCPVGMSHSTKSQLQRPWTTWHSVMVSGDVILPRKLVHMYRSLLKSLPQPLEYRIYFTCLPPPPATQSLTFLCFCGSRASQMAALECSAWNHVRYQC